MIIEDGSGLGYRAKVTPERAINAVATVFDFTHHSNHTHQESYSVVLDQTPSSASSVFYYLQNLSDTDLNVVSLTLYTTTEEGVIVTLNKSGTPSGGSGYQPANRYAGAPNVADCLSQIGNNITGLSGGDVVDVVFFNGTAPMLKHRWQSSLILKKNTTLTLSAVNGSVRIRGTLAMDFHAQLH